MATRHLAPILTFILAVGLAHPSPAAEQGKHYRESLFASGEKGLFTMELMPPRGGPVMGVNSLEIILHDAGGRDVPGAAVKVTPRMPDRMHGVEQEPVVFDRGGGAYSVENVVLTMTGSWELVVEVRKGDLADRAVFAFPAVAAGGGAGRELPAAADATPPRAASSENGLFAVSYETAGGAVPLNRIHRWTLTVATAKGEPVTGASIQVVGDMPEHGHGLPTSPEVTGEQGGGRYDVDGLRFNMPGWWVVTFHISAGEARDNVSFSILVR